MQRNFNSANNTVPDLSDLRLNNTFLQSSIDFTLLDISEFSLVTEPLPVQPLEFPEPQLQNTTALSVKPKRKQVKNACGTFIFIFIFRGNKCRY